MSSRRRLHREGCLRLRARAFCARTQQTSEKKHSQSQLDASVSAHCAGRKRPPRRRGVPPRATAGTHPSGFSRAQSPARTTGHAAASSPSPARNACRPSRRLQAKFRPRGPNAFSAARAGPYIPGRASDDGGRGGDSLGPRGHAGGRAGVMGRGRDMAGRGRGRGTAGEANWGRGVPRAGDGDCAR